MNLWATNPRRQLFCGTVLLSLSVCLMVAHISTLAQVREESVPLVGQLPSLERKLTVLEQQIELTELEGATRLGSVQEKIEVFALPEETDVSRVVALFEVIRDVLKHNGYLADMNGLQISSDGREASTEFIVHEQGMRTINLLIHTSGLLTIGDLLSEEELALLLQRIEEEHPAGLIALEQFLSADILRYAEDPKTYEEQLKKSFTSTALLSVFENLVNTSVLNDIKTLLRGDMAQSLQKLKLWPLQMMGVKEVSLSRGSAAKWYKIGLTLELFQADS